MMVWTNLVEVAVDGWSPLPIARALVSLADDERDLLARIDRKLDALLQGPLHTGRAYLLEAQDERRELRRRQESLELARIEFMRAWGNLRDDPAYATLIALNLAMIWMALGSRSDAQEWIGKAAWQIYKVWREVEDLDPPTKAGKAVRYGGILLTLPMPFLGLFGERGRTKFAARRAQRNAVPVAHLDNTVRTLCDLLGADRMDQSFSSDWWQWLEIINPDKPTDSYEVKRKWVKTDEFRRREDNLTGSPLE